MASSAKFSHSEGELAYSLSGPLSKGSKAVICVPGMGDVKEEYRFLTKQLQQAGFVAISLDLRGHGDSSVAFKDYTPDAVGRDIAALVKHLDLTNVVVVGDSMAAASATWAAAELPSVVKGIVLCGAFVRDVPVSIFIKLLLKVMLMWPWGPSAWISFYGTLYPTKKPSDFKEYTSTLKARLNQPGQLHALQKFIASSKGQCEARIGQVQCPVLFVMGSKDPDFPDPKKEAETQSARYSKARPVLMVEGAGHYPHAEFPEVVGPAIVSFCNEAF